MLLQRHPDLDELLGKAQNLDDEKLILNGLSAIEFSTLIRIEHDIETAWANGVDSVMAGMAAATGLPLEEVEARLELEFC